MIGFRLKHASSFASPPTTLPPKYPSWGWHSSHPTLALVPAHQSFLGSAWSSQLGPRSLCLFQPWCGRSQVGPWGLQSCSFFLFVFLKRAQHPPPESDTAAGAFSACVLHVEEFSFHQTISTVWKKLEKLHIDSSGLKKKKKAMI